MDGPREVVDKRWLPKDEEPPAASGGEGFDEVESHPGKIFGPVFSRLPNVCPF